MDTRQLLLNIIEDMRAFLFSFVHSLSLTKQHIIDNWTTYFCFYWIFAVKVNNKICLETGQYWTKTKNEENVFNNSINFLSNKTVSSAVIIDFISHHTWKGFGGWLIIANECWYFLKNMFCIVCVCGYHPTWCSVLNACWTQKHIHTMGVNL